MIPASFWANPVKLARARWAQPHRKRTRYITVHYNGPPVRGAGNPAAERAQLQFDAGYHMRPDVLKADGIQYHIGILSNGEILLLRDLRDRLWHCGNALGNAESVAIHIPIGTGQYPTQSQTQALTSTLETLRAEYGVHVTNLRGHIEWKQTACPGAPLSAYIAAYRDAKMHGTAYTWFRTTDNANVRFMPDVRSRIEYVIPKGTRIAVTRIVENGVPHNGNASYVQLADNSGYIHLSIVRAAA